ncbi:MAG TPA: FtsX-like permease family protein [Bryobacteraceae bacterium]
MYMLPPGFAPEKTLMMHVALSGPQYVDKAKQIAYLREVLHNLESIPGLKAFGIAHKEGLIAQSKNSATPLKIDHWNTSLVSRGYFDAMGMRLLKGRWLTDTDPPEATIINETMARKAFGAENPLGKRIEHLGGPVIGVVANLKYAQLDADPGPEMFRAYAPNLTGGNLTMTIAVRIPGDSLGLAGVLRSRVASVDPEQPVYDIASLKEMLDASVSTRRFEMLLLGTFAAAALLIAIVGIYGVVAYSLAQRTQEIGIRMALGAQRSSVIRLLVAQSIWMGLCGIGTGVGAAYGLTHLMSNLLYGVTPNDATTFATAAIVAATTLLFASWMPARRASVVDPLLALRHE